LRATLLKKVLMRHYEIYWHLQCADRAKQRALDWFFCFSFL